MSNVTLFVHLNWLVLMETVNIAQLLIFKRVSVQLKLYCIVWEGCLFFELSHISTDTVHCENVLQKIVGVDV